jgi:hypothetical protein
LTYWSLGVRVPRGDPLRGSRSASGEEEEEEEEEEDILLGGKKPPPPSSLRQR